MVRSKLRLGILLDTFLIPNWVYHSLDRVVHLDCVQICLVVLNRRDNVNMPGDMYFAPPRSGKLLSYAQKIDDILFHRGADAFSPRDSRDMLQDVPILYMCPGYGDVAGCINHNDVDVIRSYHLDILIRAGFESLSGEILTAARYGIWSYCNSRYHGYREVIGRETATSVCLYILDSGQGGRVIYKSSVQTYPFSPSRSRNRCFWVASSFLSRQIDLLYRVGDHVFFKRTEPYGLFHETVSEPGMTMLSEPELLSGHLTVFLRSIREFIRRLFHQENWYLLFVIGDMGLTSSYAQFLKLQPDRMRFWADPHVVNLQDKYFIFIEEFIRRNRKGRISVIEMEKDGSYRQPIPVLSHEYHLSYPFVFPWNGRYYMVPETSANRTIQLYECIHFPFKWQFKMNLMENILAVDSTLFFHKNKWWLFTGVTENEGALPEVELFLFSSESLLSRDWTPHPLNPIISDVKKARPAGALFYKDGRLFRPGQDCSRNYGWGFNINEIVELSENEYSEKTIVTITPEWDPDITGVHTFSQAGSITVIDACQSMGKAPW